MREKHQNRHYKHYFTFLLIMLMLVLLSSIKAKAANSVTQLKYNDEYYYLTEHQAEEVYEFFNEYNYQGANEYLNSLGETVHYMAIEDGVLYKVGQPENEKITEITIPDGVHTIAARAFQSCSDLVKVTMPDSVIKIEYGAFSYCENLETVVFSKNLNSIGEFAFQGCESLTKISLSSKVDTIDNYSFSNCPSLKNVVVPKSVTTIGKAAFYGCSSLVSIKILSNVTTIGDGVLNNCSALENMITTKGSYAETYAKENVICAITYTTKPVLEKQSCFLLVGDTYSNMVYNRGNHKVTYSSSNTKVARVNKNGLVRAVGSGSATISAVINGTTLTCKITVRKNTVANSVLQFAKNNITSDMSDYEIIEAAHAWLIQNVSYDNDNYMAGTIPDISHTAEGALVKGVAVCDGYAYAFEMIMEYFNIPCKVIVGYSGGDGHAWNLVKINKQWYHVDVTYDDPIVNGSSANTRVYTEYFLITDKQMEQDHTWKTSNYEKCTATSIDKDFASSR